MHINNYNKLHPEVLQKILVMADTQTEVNKENMTGDEKTKSQRLKMNTQKTSTLSWESKSMLKSPRDVLKICH